MPVNGYERLQMTSAETMKGFHHLTLNFQSLTPAQLSFPSAGAAFRPSARRCFLSYAARSAAFLPSGRCGFRSLTPAWPETLP